MLHLSDIDADLELVAAPELPDLASEPGFGAPEVAEALPWWNDRVFYEVFVRSFYDSDGDGIGDLRGLIERLDYLNDGDPATTDDLGITGIWLMPIAQSPSYHGYDVTDYYTIEEDYGTNADFLELMGAAHARGIVVIVDLVMNHTSSEHPWFVASAAGDPAYTDWYLWRDDNPGYVSPWGSPTWHLADNGRYYFGLFWSGMPDLNYMNP
ncbi:MAG: alpha-amylase, partial [Anaerolineae bacterium]|nr:alpha-amylase [Anaerolineae bacterium]